MVQQEDIAEIVSSVFGTIFGFDTRSDVKRTSIDTADSLKGVVHISGAWNGAVVVNVCSDLANKATAKIFKMTQDSVQLEDKQDTIAELANMIGGNIKSLLPGPATLSLPIIVSGKDLSLRLHGSEIVSDIGFIAADHPMEVILYCFTNDRNRRYGI